ncbi:hypothetical protein ACFYY2_31265 [Streptomyces sp. NPDC001822]|uniref:hypothetical protein n=1 Tax=Streptomyces sp. NPDC001822 TaxID=3364614 RepID=UPI0036C679DA
MSNQVAMATAAVMDSSTDLADRIAALRLLSGLNTERAIQVAISVTEDPDEPPIVLVAVGEELARIALETRWLTEFEVRNMSDVAFDAYCEHLK